MKKRMGSFDWLDAGVTAALYLIPPSLLIVAIAASFTHIKDWALDHAPPNTHEWQGWAFACIVELIPIFGVLLTWKLRKIEHSLTIPRWLLAVGFGISMAGQVAYAGGIAAGASRLIIAAGPSIAGLVLTEILLWLLRVLADASLPAPPPAPALVPPPPMALPPQPLSPAPPAALPAAPQDIEGEQPAVSPWATPPGTPLPTAVAPPDIVSDVPPFTPGEQGDNQQVTATVPPTVLPSANGEGSGEQAATASQDITALLPTPSGERALQDNPEGDTAPEGDSTPAGKGSAALDPTDLEVWAHHQNGKTKQELAVIYGVHPKTIQRRLTKVRTATAAEEEHSNA